MNDKSHDIVIRITAGKYAGKTYEFMLAEDSDGNKEWHVIRTHSLPPFMDKHRIEMVIRAKDDLMIASGISEKARATQIIEELERISESTDAYEHAAVLTGFNDETYYIMVDQSSPTHRALRHEGEEDPEYQVLLNVWSIYI